MSNRGREHALPIEPGLRDISEPGRYLRIRFVMGSKRGEQIIYETLLPCLSRFIPKSSLGLTYSPYFDDRERTRPAMNLALFHFDERPSISPACLAEVSKVLHSSQNSGEIGPCNYGLSDESDRFVHYSGGLVGRSYCERVESVSALHLLDYLSCHEWKFPEKSKTAFAAELTYQILLISGRKFGLGPLEVSALLKKRVSLLARLVAESGGMPYDADRLNQSARDFSEPLSNEIMSSDRPIAWQRCLTALEHSVLSALEGLERHRSEIEAASPLSEWMGRSLIHLNFFRFGIHSSNECIILQSLALCLEERLLPWTP